MARWVLPRVGGLPVDHGKMGPTQVDAIRTAILQGAHPLAIAPEGQVTYSAWSIQRVEPGFARLGFMVADELQAQGKDTRVIVLPVSLFQHYPAATEKKLLPAVAKLEKTVFGVARTGAIWERLNGIRDGILAQTEAWYRQVHGYEVAEAPWSKERLVPLLEMALTVGERILGLPHGGEFFARLYKIRSTGWDRIYPVADGWKAKPALEQRLAYRATTEAWSAFRHMELADLAWYLGQGEPDQNSTPAYLADYAENLYDLIVRLSGGNISHRKVLFPRGIQVVFGNPLDLTARLDGYRTKKKETLAQTVADLIDEWRKANPEDSHE